MRLVATAWYLFGLLVIAALIESAITYAPSAQHQGQVMFGVTVGIAGALGLAAVGLTIVHKRRPESQIFRSKPVFTVAVCVAAMMTLLLLGAVG